MKIFQINGGVFGSTGKIMFGIADVARKQGHEVMCAAPITSTNHFKQPKEAYLRIGSYYERCISVLLARLTGLEGCFSFLPTYRLLRQIDAFAPDVLHLHSIHNSYLNIPMLFHYIKQKNLRVVWTLHDCWAMTGHCTHFDMIGCQKWKTSCVNCPQYREYPKSYFDNARKMHTWKKKWFSGVEDMTIVTPSYWLAEIVKESFLKDYPELVIHNGINLSLFKPQESKFRAKYHCEDKKIVLGVAFGWGKKKGLDVFIELARRLDRRFQIVLVGTDEQVENLLPENIISIRRTQNQQELAEIYSVADVFVNPTREDSYPTVNMEAIACGTPVITFNSGGSPEILDNSCGIVVAKDDIDAMEVQIRKVCDEKKCWEEACRKRSCEFDAQKRFELTIALYEN